MLLYLCQVWCLEWTRSDDLTHSVPHIELLVDMHSKDVCHCHMCNIISPKQRFCGCVQQQPTWLKAEPVTIAMASDSSCMASRSITMQFSALT